MFVWAAYITCWVCSGVQSVKYCKRNKLFSAWNKRMLCHSLKHLHNFPLKTSRKTYVSTKYTVSTICTQKALHIVAPFRPLIGICPTTFQNTFDCHIINIHSVSFCLCMQFAFDFYQSSYNLHRATSDVSVCGRTPSDESGHYNDWAALWGKKNGFCTFILVKTAPLCLSSEDESWQTKKRSHTAALCPFLSILHLFFCVLAALTMEVKKQSLQPSEMEGVEPSSLACLFPVMK